MHPHPRRSSTRLKCPALKARDAALIVPWRDTGSRRRHNFENMMELWRRFDVSRETCIVDSGHGQFSRGASLNQGVRETRADILILADACLLPSHDSVASALALASSEACVALPFETCHQTRPSGEMFEEGWLSVGGINIMRRDVFEAIGGFDERYVGWGWEDNDFGRRIVKAGFELRRGTGKVIHQYHPRAQVSDANRQLWEQSI